MNMNHTRQSGFNLLEVLIAIAIFAIGMMALASLQGNLTRSAADANTRTVAVNLAETLIETRRGFARVTDPTNTLPAYDDIADETITVTRGGITYTINSVVTPYWYNLAGDNFTTTEPGGSPIPDYKLMTVTVNWAAPDFRSVEGTEVAIGTGSITVADTISSLTSAASSRVLTQEKQDVAAPPVDYNPGARPDIVSLSLGDNKFKESLLPEPDVIRRNELVETRFDVITYSQTDAGALFLRREEFAVVSCECTLKAPSGDPETSGRRPTIWAGDEYAEGHFVDKPYGVEANNQQSAFCGICCRDHHDGGSSTDDHSDTAVNQYDPFKPTTEYWTTGTFDGDHKHYNRVRNGNNPPTLELADAVNDTYVEACKLVRKDGFFKVAQDFRQEDRHVFPEDFLDDQSEVDTYSDYVTEAADAYEDAAYPNYEAGPPCIGGPSPCVAEPDYGNPYPDDLGNNKFPTWTELPLAGEDTQQLRSRGLYIDYLSSDLRSVLDCLRSGGDEDSCQTGDVVLDRTLSTNILEIIPFYDVQLTFLNRWTETPTNTPVDTTNEGLEDDNAHSRGVASKEALGGSDVEASGHRGNLGLTDTAMINPQFSSDVMQDTIEVQAEDGSGGGGGTPNPGTDPVVAGNVSETVNGLQATDIEVIGLNGAVCDRTVGGYECSVPPAASNPRLKVYGYGKNNTDRYACSTGSVLVKNSQVVNGANAEAVFELHATPTNPEGTTYHIHVQSTACT
ncbi:MAG: prepilin-type N-terminal cleavage/methylation domain-containing protein [Xanthomonadales bacterium]|nr:prepilin-type N-terminal cleavage/methylation domain-containing protein [Xanthomonadales bacterium]